ncbi:MAG: YkgJ family cysteine cluster protein, partial [Phycisphaerae bacterium]
MNGCLSQSTPERPWYADGLVFTCVRCGNCCSGAPGYVWVSPNGIRAIATRLGMSPQRFEQQHTRRVGRRQSL